MTRWLDTLTAPEFVLVTTLIAVLWAGTYLLLAVKEKR